eukprot:TRINITY_DN1936_c0_g1_i1.p1 TRINITY_DN1936_c0_g1~~TRINITY_DN1936_c0_g1_i1.p1  ORF type:complete len:425 (+),score=200.04 TRINITY_DN1936_c0_g1_i1:63-1337(+)
MLSSRSSAAIRRATGVAQCLTAGRTMSTVKGDRAVIVSAVRTPIISFGGALSSLSAPQLGAVAIKAAVERAGIDKNSVQEAYIGNVLSANIGQAPARQAVLGAGLPQSVVCTTVNKVCASGLKAVALASQSVMLGQHHTLVAGGMESMSNVPFYVGGARFGGLKYGHSQLTDGVLKDGLWDVYNDFHMGMCAEDCAKKYGFTRADQDAHAIESYKRVAEAYKSGAFKNEIVPVSIANKGKEATIIGEDDEYTKIKMDKVPTVKPAFDPKNGTVTAVNASSLNDGAAALVIMSESRAQQLGLKPLARVIGFADAEQAPIEFTTAPSKAIPKALEFAGVNIKDVDFFEINQAFSVVSLANLKLLNLDPAKVDVNGGAVALGHPIGASGARIVTTLVHTLHARNGKIGVAAICNGGGGASAIVIERL